MLRKLQRLVKTYLDKPIEAQAEPYSNRAEMLFRTLSWG